jgi:hypothetical protein
MPGLTSSALKDEKTEMSSYTNFSLDSRWEIKDSTNLKIIISSNALRREMAVFIVTET